MSYIANQFIIEYMIRGMATAGFVPKELLALADSIPGGLNLAVIDMLAQRAGNAASGTSGIQALMGQPVSVLNTFLPQEKKDELTSLFVELNR